VIRVLLDTSTCVELLRGRTPQVRHRLGQLHPDHPAISCITLAELEYGVAKSADPARHGQILLRFCTPLIILPFDAAASACYGRVRRELELKGTPIGALDTLIASHALSRDLTLVTGNDREFSRVEGLRVENWQA